MLGIGRVLQVILGDQLTDQGQHPINVRSAAIPIEQTPNLSERAPEDVRRNPISDTKCGGEQQTIDVRQTAVSMEQASNVPGMDQEHARQEGILDKCNAEHESANTEELSEGRSTKRPRNPNFFEEVSIVNFSQQNEVQVRQECQDQCEEKMENDKAEPESKRPKCSENEKTHNQRLVGIQEVSTKRPRTPVVDNKLEAEANTNITASTNNEKRQKIGQLVETKYDSEVLTLQQFSNNNIEQFSIDAEQPSIKRQRSALESQKSQNQFEKKMENEGISELDSGVRAELSTLLERNNYIAALLHMLRENYGLPLNETQILDCTQGDCHYNPAKVTNSELYKLIFSKIGEIGIKNLNEQIKSLNSKSSFLSMLIQVYKCKPDNSVFVCLGKQDFKFEGKILCVSDPKGVHSASSEILSAKRDDSTIRFKLENGSKVELSLRGSDISEVLFWKESRYDLINYLTKYYRSRAEIRIQNLFIQDELILEGGVFEIEETHPIKEVSSKAILKQLSKGFSEFIKSSSWGAMKVYGHSFALRQKKQNYCSVTMYNNIRGEIVGIEVSIKKLKYYLHPKEVKGTLVYVMSDPVSIVDYQNNFKNTLKIREKVLDENKVKLEKLEEINRRYTEIVGFLKQELNGDYLEQLLVNLVKNELETIEERLISSNIIEKLRSLSDRYEQIEIKLTVQEILKKAVLDANYSKLINKGSNIAVFKIMELLNRAFEFIDKMQGKDLVLFLGDTGSGKSTTINYYLGLDLTQAENRYGQSIVKLENEESLVPGGYAKIGQSICTSETTIVQGYSNATTTLSVEKEPVQLVLADCPGTKDTRGLDYDLATVLSIDQTIKNCNSIKAIVLTLPYEAFLLNRANPVIELFRDLQERVPNVFTNLEIKQALFLTITKHGTHGNPSDKLSSILDGFLNEENNRLNQFNNVSDVKNDFEIVNIKERLAIWHLIRSVFDAERVNFLSIEDTVARENMLQAFAKSRGIQKGEFTKAMDRSDIQRRFEKNIVMSLHTWQELIFKQYLEVLPKRIDGYDQDIKLKKEEILNIEAENKQQLDTILSIIKDVANREKEVKDLEETLKANEQLSSHILAQVGGKLKILKDEQLSTIIKFLEDLAKEISNAEKKLEIKKEEISAKSLEIQGIENKIDSLIDEISKLSSESHVEVLGGFQKHAPDSKFAICDLKSGTIQKRFTQVEGISDEDTENKRTVQANEYKGELNHLVLIERDYYIMPREQKERDEFIREGRAGEGAYRAELSGDNYELTLGKKPHPGGKKIVYAFRTHWNGDVIPWFSITHTIPNVDFNEALIINKEAEKSVEIKEKALKKAELSQLGKEAIAIQEEIDNKKQNQAVANSERERIEKSVIVAGLADLINENKSIIRQDNGIKLALNEAIDHNMAKILECNFYIQNKQKDSNASKKMRFHFAIVLNTQLKIATLLRRFAALGISNELGIDKKDNHSPLHDVCQSYCDYFDKNIKDKEEVFLKPKLEVCEELFVPETVKNLDDMLSSRTSLLKPGMDSNLKVVIIPNEPCQYEIDVPSDGTCLFYSVVFSYLLPVTNNIEEFNNRFVKMFGEEVKGSAEENRIRLLAYNGSVDFIRDNAFALEVLVNENFRDRVVNFMKDHRRDFIQFIGSSKEFTDRMRRMKGRSEWADEPEIQAISQILEVKIVICNDKDGQIVSIAHKTYGEEFSNKLYLVHTTANKNIQGAKNHYHYLVDMRHIGDAANSKEKKQDPMPNKSVDQVKVISASAEPGVSEIEFLNFTISYADLKYEPPFGKELGRGGFGVVYRGKWKKYADVAIKKLHTSQLTADVLTDFKNEMRVMAGLHSPQIVQLYGVHLKEPYCIVMEFMQKGSLFNLLHSKCSLSWPQRTKIALEMAKGLSFLHSKDVIHSDLKSANVLLNESLVAKLSDFGLAKVKTECYDVEPGGTLFWMAPELFRSRATCTKQSDIYSLGMTLWELASRKTPFEDEKFVTEEAFLEQIEAGRREKIPAETPPVIAKLITHCWRATAKSRPTADEVVEKIQELCFIENLLGSDEYEYCSEESVKKKGKRG